MPALWLAGLLLLLGGCASSRHPAASVAGAATIELTGTVGAPVTGYYIRDGRRVELTGVLPMTIHEAGVSQIAVRKVNAQDRLVLSARLNNDSTSTSIPAGKAEGLRLDLAGGLGASVIRADESLAPPANALIVIAPYWYEGTWVFDDARTGLSREPFVAGVPEMMNTVLADIPDARAGFRLTCSARPFPGWQKKLVWVRAESGGNFYRLADTTMEGWLCPAMFRYFSEAPKELYLKAESKAR